MFSKGADSSMFDRCQLDENQRKKLQDRADRMARKSYRTMVLAMRPFDAKLCEAFKQYEQNNRSKELQLEFERDMTFLGITALEDTLQWHVPQTIERLSNSGIKVWICTGDKFETTLAVAQACKLVSRFEENRVSIIGENLEQIKRTIQKGLQKLQAGHDLQLLAISGVALVVIRNDDQLANQMLQLVKIARSTIFVRMSPSQKVQVIEMAKRDLKLEVLAIGDGYNDQLMLQAADVGIRINQSELIET